MILTFKVKHNKDFSSELEKAKNIAQFAIKNKNKLSSKNVSHFGLKSAISNQILRKYGNNKTIKKVNRVNLVIPNQSIKLNKLENTIEIKCLNLKFSYQFRYDFEKVNQIEINNEYFFVSVSIKEKEELKTEGWVGVDRNTTGHCAVVACSKNNKVILLGKKAKHIHTKYKSIRRKLQKKKKFSKLKQIKNRESRIVRDLNHKISKKIVEIAERNNCGIKFEKLKGIRKTAKSKKSFRYNLNSWSYYQLEQMIIYKAKMLGIPVSYIEPAYTSQNCHKCGLLGKRNDKSFKCPHCGYTSHADVNASWNICNSVKFLTEGKSECLAGADLERVCQKSLKEGDFSEGNTDIPKEEIVQNATNLRTSVALA